MSTKKTAKKTTKKVAATKKKPVAKKVPAKSKAKASAKRFRVTNGPGKRTPAELASIKSRIVERVEVVGGGVTGEELAKEIGKTSKELAMPLRQLRAEGTLSTTGQRRFLRYFPKGKAPKAKK